MRLHVVDAQEGDVPCAGEAFGGIEAYGEGRGNSGATGGGDEVGGAPGDGEAGGRVGGVDGCGGREGTGFGEVVDGFLDEGGQVGVVPDDGYSGVDAAVGAVVGGDLFVEEEAGRGAGLFKDGHAGIIAGCFDGEGEEWAGWGG